VTRESESTSGVTQGPTIVVTADADLTVQVCDALRRVGFAATGVDSLEAAKAALREGDPELVIADAALPAAGCQVLLFEAQRCGVCPVIVLVDTDQEGIEWLERGASDFVRRPINPRELVIRSQKRARSRHGETRIQYDDLVIDLTGRRVFMAEATIDLTALEFDLLVYLASHPGRAFTREELLEGVLRSSTQWQDVGTVTEHIYRIRHKLDPDGARDRWLITVRGEGYRFDPAP